jgi:hypothetical protein
MSAGVVGSVKVGGKLAFGARERLLDKLVSLGWFARDETAGRVSITPGGCEKVWVLKSLVMDIEESYPFLEADEVGAFVDLAFRRTREANAGRLDSCGSVEGGANGARDTGDSNGCWLQIGITNSVVG